MNGLNGLCILMNSLLWIGHCDGLISWILDDNGLMEGPFVWIENLAQARET